MANTPLEYEKIIWKVFAVAVTASVIILYYSISPDKFPNVIFRILALSLGFSILAYSFMLIIGYGIKKRIILDIINPNPPIPNHRFIDENICITSELARRLNNRCYPRVRYIAEFIFLIIAGFYIYSFAKIELWSVTIPILISLIFALISCLVNLKVI